MLLHVFRVDQSHDAIQPEIFFHLVVHEKRLRHGRWISHARGFDQHAVELFQASILDAIRKLFQDDDEILSHRATDATVHHLDDLFFDLL